MMEYLKAENIILRALEPEDLEVLYKWENDSTIWDTGNTIAPYSYHELRNYINSSSQDIYQTGQLRLMIVTQSSGEAIGTIDLYDFSPHDGRAGIGIMIAPEHRQQGYAGNAIQLLINYSKHFLQLHQLYAHIPENNRSSLALFSKCGFSESGKLIDWQRCGEQYYTIVVMQRIFRQ